MGTASILASSYLLERLDDGFVLVADMKFCLSQQTLVTTPKKF